VFDGFGHGITESKEVRMGSELLHELGLSVEQLAPIAAPGEALVFQSDAPASRWPALEDAAWFPPSAMARQNTSAPAVSVRTAPP